MVKNMNLHGNAIYFMNIYIHIYIPTYIYIYVYIYIHIPTYIHIYVCVCIFIYIPVSQSLFRGFTRYIYPNTYTHTYIDIKMADSWWL